MIKILEKKQQKLNYMFRKEVTLSENQGYFQVLIHYPSILNKDPKVYTYKKIENAKKRFNKIII